jgi:hypothetical protein
VHALLSILGLATLAGCADGRQVNGGAAVPVTEGCSRVDMERTCAVAGAQACFLRRPESIFLTGYLTRAGRLFLHEFVHLAEQRLIAAGDVEGARIVRHAFRDLCAPGFELGRDDLMTDLP